MWKDNFRDDPQEVKILSDFCACDKAEAKQLLEEFRKKIV